MIKEIKKHIAIPVIFALMFFGAHSFACCQIGQDIENFDEDLEEDFCFVEPECQIENRIQLICDKILYQMGTIQNLDDWKFLTDLAEKDHPLALYGCGLAYHKGAIGAMNSVQALDYYTRAVGRGYNPALCKIGELYYNSSQQHDEVKLRNDDRIKTDLLETAMHYLERGTEIGCIRCLYSLYEIEQDHPPQIMHDFLENQMNLNIQKLENKAQIKDESVNNMIEEYYLGRILLLQNQDESRTNAGLLMIQSAAAKGYVKAQNFISSEKFPNKPPNKQEGSCILS